MNVESDVRKILLEEFLKIQEKNSSFSMRAYSKRVGVPQSAISEILSGKRKITIKMAEKILSGLNLSPAVLQNILKRFTSPEMESVNSNYYSSLDLDTYRVIAEWHYFAILSLAETKSFRSDSNWIARRLNISNKKAKEAIDKLLKLELLEKDNKEQIKPTGLNYQYDPGMATSALKLAQRQTLDLAQEKINTTTYEERDFTSITLCFDPNKMSIAKKIIKKFRKEFCQEMESFTKKEVYKLSVQLFPLTNKEIK